MILLCSERLCEEAGPVRKWAGSCVDYSLGTRDVYLSTAKHIVDLLYMKPHPLYKKRTHILSFFKQTEVPSGLDLPTWVPDWSATRNTTGLTARPAREIDHLIPYDAQVEGESLVISGCIVDEIIFCSNILVYDHDMIQELQLCHMLTEQEHKMGNASVYGGLESQFEGFWRTIIIDNPTDTDIKTLGDHTYHLNRQNEVSQWITGCRLAYDKARQEWLDEFHRRPRRIPKLSGILPKKYNSEVTKLKNGSEIVDPFGFENSRWGSQGMRRQLTPHILIKTKQGYFGLADPSVQRGDVVALLAACSYPFYLRRKYQHYTLAGKAWVHGLMYESDSFFQSDHFRRNCTKIELR